MEVFELILCIILLVLAVFLVVAVLMQQGKSEGLSGTITGGGETFFGKTQGRSKDAVLSKVTTVVAIIFVIVVGYLHRYSFYTRFSGASQFNSYMLLL